MIVPFDRENNRVLGGSAEPYLNNPVRIKAIALEYRDTQKNKSGYDALLCVLNYAQANPSQCRALLLATLNSISRRMEIILIAYASPQRIGLPEAVAAVEKFLADPSGGARMQIAVAALFVTLARRLGVFATVRTSHVNAADASSGAVADVECIDGAGKIVLAIDAKDRELTLRQVQDKIPGCRQNGVQALLFILRSAMPVAQREALDVMIKQQFSTGLNIYIFPFMAFLEVALIILGEHGRSEYLREIGAQLDAARVGLFHRQAWRDLLAAL